MSETADESAHQHECADREDDVCGPRGYCRCECGAIRRWASRESLKAEPDTWLADGPEWQEPAKRLELDPSLPWWMDPFRVRYDDMRERGVAMVQLSWSSAWDFARMLGSPPNRPDRKMPFFGKLWVLRCTIPRDHKYTVMLAIAYGFCDGWYVAEKINQREQHWDEEYYTRRTIPTYEALRNRITDGFGFDDEPGSGDWLIACRIALHLTADRYENRNEPLRRILW